MKSPLQIMALAIMQILLALFLLPIIVLILLASWVARRVLHDKKWDLHNYYTKLKSLLSRNIYMQKGAKNKVQTDQKNSDTIDVEFSKKSS